jgi:hypothetical protein
MFGSTCAIVLWGALTASAPVAPPAPMVFEGTIKDVRGTDGSLTLTIGQGKQAKDWVFLIVEARIMGPDGDEIKVGDLRRGDRVKIEMTRDGRMVQLIHLLPVLKGK